MEENREFYGFGLGYRFFSLVHETIVSSIVSEETS